MLLLFLAACQEDAPTINAAGPDLLEAERVACERTGGRWSTRGGSKLFICFRDLPDAGKLCRVASDCSGLCLARSRTCSPIEPFLGCHEVLSEGGGQQTLCVN